MLIADCCFGEDWHIQTKPKCFGSSGKSSSICQGRTFVPFGGILEREVSGRRFSTVFEQPVARKLKKREHRYLWAEVNKSVWGIWGIYGVGKSFSLLK